MSVRLISLLPLQVARLLGLVRSIRAVRVLGDRRNPWALLVEGRGFARLLRKEVLYSPGLIRVCGWNLPRPARFASPSAARRYGQSVGLLARQTRWHVETY